MSKQSNMRNKISKNTIGLVLYWPSSVRRSACPSVWFVYPGSSKPQSALRVLARTENLMIRDTETNTDYVDPQSKSSSRSNFVHYAGLFVIGYSRLNWKQVDKTFPVSIIAAVYGMQWKWESLLNWITKLECIKALWGRSCSSAEKVIVSFLALALRQMRVHSKRKDHEGHMDVYFWLTV